MLKLLLPESSKNSPIRNAKGTVTKSKVLSVCDATAEVTWGNAQHKDKPGTADNRGQIHPWRHRNKGSVFGLKEEYILFTFSA